MQGWGSCDRGSIPRTLKCMTKVKVICSFCRKAFFRENGRFNEAKKFGWNQYCSRKCQDQAKIKKAKLECANPSCNKIVFREPAELKKSKSGRVFCSQSCAAVINNSNRDNSKRRKIKICPTCEKEFFGHRKYCSKVCRPKPPKSPGLPFGFQRISEKQIISEIKKFYKLKGRIPVKREFHHYNAARLRFGTWNKAIEAAGFEPNPVLFAKKFIAKDGHVCDSFAEKIIDEWLTSRKIKHERDVHYPEDKKLTTDFVTKNNWIEFFGLAGELKDYDKVMERKKTLSKKYRLQLIEIYPKDLFPINRLQEIMRIKNI